ncbi:hypothetical protein LZ30DRAFT_776731 [Colletotrichum cereale]|nr:hypothetical protein LZ30DRAFT_776731 [Colletotrichum cereale]
MPKQRAVRTSPAQWADFKPLIRSLYANKKLQEVISHLWEQHKFFVTKRQLVYRLGIWNYKKYNKGDDAEEDDEEVHMRSSSESLEAYDADDVTDDENDPMTDIQGTLEVQRANALSAVSDGRSAWESYCLVADFAEMKSLIALARSAETPEQCERTLEILERCISKPSDAVMGSWCHLLYFHVCETMSYGTGQSGMDQLSQNIKESIGDTVSLILAGGNHPDGTSNFLFRASGSLDMIALLLLDSVYEESFLHSHSAADDQCLLDLLSQTNSWVLSGGSPSPPVLVLKRCAHWCQQQLLDVSDKLTGDGLEGAATPNLRVPTSENQRSWRDHVEVFGALWGRMAASEWRGVVKSPGWTRACVQALGISHEELLSCMCWVILRFDPPRRAVPGSDLNDWEGVRADGGECGHDARELFVRAAAAARGVAGLGPEDLWGAFLLAFRSVNSVTITGGWQEDARLRGEVRAFKDAVMADFGAFVDRTLGGFDGGAGGDESAAEPGGMWRMGSVSPADMGDMYTFC